MTALRFNDLVYEVRDGVAWVRLNRPGVLNAFSSRLYGELKTAIRLADTDDDIDTVVITGTGRAFGTGGDVEEGLRYLDESADPLDIYRFEDNLPYEAIRNSDKVVVAAVNGICMAGGLIVALSSDIVVAIESATFGIPEGRVGMAEPWVPAMLFGRMSLTQVKYLALTGGTITAADAEALGLVTLVVGDDELDTAVAKVVSELRTTTLEARRRYKAYINRLVPTPAASEAVRVMRSPGAVDALRAFAENRSRPKNPPDA